MELRLTEKQGSEIRILAPDEPQARAAFEQAHPKRVRERREFLSHLTPATLDLAQKGEEEENEESEGGADEEVAESENEDT